MVSVSEAGARRLLFRIGEVGFSLALENLVEICEQVAGRIDLSRTDAVSQVMGSLPFRRTQIPVVDLAARLELELEVPDTVLVLSSKEGNWALPVSEVLGFVTADDLVDRALPRLLLSEGWRCFSHAGLLNGRPFLKLQLGECYAGEVS